MFGGESFGKKLHRYCNNQNLTNNCSILLSGESFGKKLHRYCNNQKFEKQLQHNVVLGEVLERSYRYCNNKQLQHNVVVGEVLKRNYMLPVLPQQHNVGWEKLLEKRYTAITITNLTNNCRIDKVAAVIEEALEEQYTAKL